MQDGILFKKSLKKDGTVEYTQCIVPLAFKTEVLHQMHDSLVSGHMGCKKTKEEILLKY